MYYPPEPIEFSPPYKGVTSWYLFEVRGEQNGSRWNALLSVPVGCSGGGLQPHAGAITAQNRTLESQSQPTSAARTLASRQLGWLSRGKPSTNTYVSRRPQLLRQVLTDAQTYQ